MRGIKNKIVELCQGTDIDVVKVDIKNMYISVRLPYDSNIITIDLEGETQEEVLESFVDGVNKELDEMINYLEDCKLSKSQII
jgi:hypothetical protein